MARKQSATVQLKVRMKEPLRARIERAANQRGVSLNAEIVGRLEQSLLKEGAKYDEFGGEDYYRLGQVLMLAIQEGELISRERWFATPDSIDKTAGFLVSFLDYHGRRFGKGPGTTSEMDYQRRLKELRRLAEKTTSSEPPTRDK